MAVDVCSMWLTYVLAVCLIAHGIILAIHIREDMKNIDRIWKEIDRLSAKINDHKSSTFDRATLDYLHRLGRQVSYVEKFFHFWLNDEK